jgi:cell surface protein SprA
MGMQRFYQFLGLYKNKRKKSAAVNVPFVPLLANKAVVSEPGSFLLDLVTMVKRMTFNYSENNGRYLPGFTQRVGFLGTNRPSMGFVFGSQSDVRFNAARRGWLTTFEDFNEPFVTTHNNQLKFNATAQPLKDLTIDIFADKQYTNNYRETFKVTQQDDITFEYLNLLGNTQGNFSMSSMMIGTFFSSGNKDQSPNFERFKENRGVIATRLASLNPLANNTLDNIGFPEAFGKTSQQVLLPAFIAAYTGKSASKVGLSAFDKIPIPNWNMKYTGLMRLDWFKEKFTRFSLSHGYKAAYSVNSFGTNLEKENSQLNPLTSDERPDYIFNNLVINDAFNPLIRVDFETKNSLSVLFEMKMDRALSLSFDNNLLTEIQGKEYTMGVGYRIKDVTFVTRIGGSKKRLKSDLNIKADLSLRDHFTLIRNLDLDNTQISAGQYFLSAKIRAEYALSQNLNALFFYDYTFSKYAVSTAFPQSLINTGISLRYNFGN